MPIMRCQKGGKKGWKWGKGGTCFTGSDGKSRAQAVARAAYARGYRGTEGDVHKIEAVVASMNDAELSDALAILPATPEEFVLKMLDEETQQEDVRVGIKKADEELQIVWGEVYVPGLPDAHGHMMNAEEVRKMAYRTLADGLQRGEFFQGSDVQHDNQQTDCVIVESFIAREDDSIFIPGSWVVGMHIPDSDLWARVKKGELNGFSIQASVLMREAEIEVDLPELVTGETEGPSDGELHHHGYRVRFDTDGVFLGGETDVVGGHSHKIQRGSVTAREEDHVHRYNLLDVIFAQANEGA